MMSKINMVIQQLGSHAYKKITLERLGITNVLERALVIR
ncbi:hypothetical protein ALQ76_02118 [Pseudomonas syringae pv. atrofaciens]|nr:hypothetical protein ALQ76_02118 [Pseudomonas syringae pv. atrofaciens]